MAAGTEHSVAAATHEAKQPLDISRPPAGILIVDNFLDEAEISDALTQLDRLEKERGDQQTACPAKRQFLINVPAVADRLRSEIDASLGLVPIEATEGGAPQQEWLPARVMRGPTAAHRDEPQSAAPWAQSLDATKLDKEAYRGGYIAIVYLGGDGALVLGSGPAAREVPVVPGRLVAWPNTDFVHSAHGHERRLLGPLAVVPGDRTAPLWLTVIASLMLKPRDAYFLQGMFIAIVAWLIAQLTMGIVFLDDDSKCSSNAAPFGLAIWNLTSFCWKAFIMAFFIIGQVLIHKFGPRSTHEAQEHRRTHGGEDSKDTEAAAERLQGFLGQVLFYLLVVHMVWIILGSVITAQIPRHSSCPSRLYWFTAVSILALYVNTSMMMVPAALKYTKWRVLAIGGLIVVACTIVALDQATELPAFGRILVAASTFPASVIVGLVAIDVCSWWRKYINSHQSDAAMFLVVSVSVLLGVLLRITYPVDG